MLVILMKMRVVNDGCQSFAIFAKCEPEEGEEVWTVVPVRCATPIEFQKLCIEFMECFLFKVNPTFNMRVQFFFILHLSTLYCMSSAYSNLFCRGFVV